MKTLVVLLTLAATIAALGQGQVEFQTKNSIIGLDAPITYGEGGPVSPGTKPNGAVHIASGSQDFGGYYARAGLYGGAVGTAESALVLLTPVVPFRTTAATSGYINPTADGGNATRTLQGVDIGQSAIFQVRAWDCGVPGIDSYEAAIQQCQGIIYAGKGNIITVASLGGGGVSPSPLVGIQGFTMSLYLCPEPSTIVLGIVGAVAGLFMFRRRQ